MNSKWVVPGAIKPCNSSWKGCSVAKIRGNFFKRLGICDFTNCQERCVSDFIGFRAIMPLWDKLMLLRKSFNDKMDGVCRPYTRKLNPEALVLCSLNG